MSRGIQLTADQREAVYCLDRDCIVHAGAGSGKTRVLVERFLAILEKHGLDPDLLDEVVAITFTEKAAAEMKERIRKEVGRRIRLAREKGNEEEASGWYRIFTELERARVTTIHSFCLHILKRYPVEAGLDPQVEVLQEVESWRLLKESVEEAFSRYFSLEPAYDGRQILEDWLVDTGLDEAQKQVQAVISDMFSHGWSVSDLKDITWRDLDQRAEERQKRLSETVPLLEEQMLQSVSELLSSSSKSAKAEDFRQEFIDLDMQWAQADLRGKVDILRRLDEALRPNWGKKDARQRCRNAVSELISILENYLRTADERKLLSAFFEVMDEAVQGYARRKAARAAIDYDEMQWRVCELMEKDPVIREEIRQGIRYLMVDEYQDINHLQKRLIDLAIRNEFGESEPGKLFVVGDPKQSIYRFRGADVSLFHQTHREIEAGEQGKAVHLSDNFRSDPELIRLYNFLFGRLMSGEETCNNYSPAKAGKERTGRTHVAEWIPVESYRLPEGWNHRDMEAVLLAARIRDMIDHEGIQPGEIAILFRAMTHVKKYERELARAGIPFYVVKGRGFYDRQEVSDLIHFLRILVRPHDRQAMAGVLRSPLCGVADGTITRIALELNWNGDPSEWARIPDLPEEERRKLVHFGILLENARKLSGTVHISEWLERLLEDSGYFLSAWAVPEGKQIAANLRKLVGQAALLDGLEAWSVSHYLDLLEFLAEEQERETEAAVESEDSNCVKLMSIHQAKGLEFPVVFVPDLSHDPRLGTPSLFACEEAGLVVELKEGKGTKPFAPDRYEEAKERSIRLQKDESARLLYVAMTRAERLLVLSGVKETPKEKELCKQRKWIHWLCTILDDEKMDLQAKEWRFSEDCLPIRVVDGITPDVSGGKWSHACLDELVAGKELFRSVPGSGEEVPLFMPRGFTEHDVLEMSVTEWKEMENCPRQYFYRRVATIPRLETDGEASANGGQAVLPPNVRGTVVHRVIELLAPSGTDGRPWTEWAEKALDELEVSPEDRRQALEEIRPFVQCYLSSEVYNRQLAGRSVETERRFELEIPGLRMIGVIDCLLQGPDGTWEIVDYKTDSVDPDNLDDTAVEYLPQLKMYTLAAEKLFGIRPARASLLFLKTGQEWSRAVSDEWLAAAEASLQETARRLRSISSEDPWEPRPGKRCRYCDFRWMCESAAVSEDDKPNPVELSW